MNYFRQLHTCTRHWIFPIVIMKNGMAQATPRSLKGEQIPFPARIFALVDVWDTLTNDRPYRKAWPKAKVLEHICAGSGSHFDPQITAVFLIESTNYYRYNKS